MALNTFKCNHLTPLHFKGLVTDDSMWCYRLEPGWCCY